MKGRIMSRKGPVAVSSVIRISVLTLLLLWLPSQVVAVDSALWRSLIIPGAGQAHRGHYKKAALFAGVAIGTGVGLVVSHVHYNQAVDTYRAERRAYLFYPQQYQSGTIVSIDDINATYSAMQNAFEAADSRLTWRNVFLTSLISVYVLNLVDILMTDPNTVDTDPRYSFETDGHRVLLTRSFRF